MPIKEKEHNVVLITPDSCRYDTAQKAHTPHLDTIAPLKKGETSGSYTYPAHQAFFLGDLPRVDEYLPGKKQIWRSSGARKLDRDDSIALKFNEKDIITWYQSLDYNVQGFGGVGFFNTYNPHNVLPALFDHFHYFGEAINPEPDKRMPRGKTLPLTNIDYIAEKAQQEPYFLFINSIATHLPYDVPDTDLTDHYLQLISRTFSEHKSKKKHEELPFTDEEIFFLKTLQILALQWVDQQIGELLAELPKNLPTLAIICADHGEEFGDHGRFGHAHPDQTVMEVPVWAGILKSS